MRAAVIDDPPGIEVRTRPRPEPADDQAVVAVERVGICGSDVPMWTGDREVPTPHVPGHEFAGTVVDVGADVTRVSEGERVAARIASGCQDCRFCHRGDVRLCESISETGITRDGAFAEYVSVDARTLHRLPDSLTFAEGASVDPAASAYRGIAQLDVGAGDSLVVVGPGPIGLYAVQLAVAEGTSTVVVLGTRESRNRVARDLGADATVDVREEDVDARLDEIFDGGRADAVLEATGNPAATPTAIDAVGPGGAVAMLGLHYEPVEALDFTHLVRSEKRILGGFLYTYEEFSTALRLFESGDLTTEGILTHTLPLTEVQRGFELIEDRAAIKVQLDPTR